MTTAEKKKKLRKQVLALRNKMTKEDRNLKSMQILNTLYPLTIYQRSGIILTYVEYQSEVMTTPLIESALSENKQVFVPKVTGNDMEFYQINSLSELSEGYKGIREPESFKTPFALKGSYDKTRILMLMPGAAFDKAHHRIGYGRGFYDRYLAHLSTSGLSVYTAALCYECQLLAQIPHDIHDIRPNMIITEERIYDKENTL